MTFDYKPHPDTYKGLSWTPGVDPWKFDNFNDFIHFDPREPGNHTCIDCKNPIGKTSKRCRDCNGEANFYFWNHPEWPQYGAHPRPSNLKLVEAMQHRLVGIEYTYHIPVDPRAHLDCFQHDLFDRCHVCASSNMMMDNKWKNRNITRGVLDYELDAPPRPDLWLPFLNFKHLGWDEENNQWACGAKYCIYCVYPERLLYLIKCLGSGEDPVSLTRRMGVYDPFEYTNGGLRVNKSDDTPIDLALYRDIKENPEKYVVLGRKMEPVEMIITQPKKTNFQQQIDSWLEAYL